MLYYGCYGLHWACVFSFLGVVEDACRRERAVKGRSHCPVCGRTLSAAELIPCLSYLPVWQNAAAACKNSRMDFWIEVLGGHLCLRIRLRRDRTGAEVFAVLGILTVVALTDMDTLEIYDRFPVLLFVCGIAAHILIPSLGIKSRLIGCVIVSVPMLLLALIVPGGFGGGDIKLMFGAGFFLGAKLTVVAAFIGILLGGGFGALLLAQKKANRKSQFAFGPFLCIGIAIAMFFGETIADWYMGLL